MKVIDKVVITKEEFPRQFNEILEILKSTFPKDDPIHEIEKKNPTKLYVEIVGEE